MSDSLSRRFNRTVLLKLETLAPIRSFKHRGATVAVEQLVAEHPEIHTVVTASTGNHGQGIAHAVAQAGLSSVVFAPETASAEKLDAMRMLGAEVRIQGESLADSQSAAQASKDAGFAYIEDGESPHLMAGAATVLSEMIEARPDLGAVVVPIGGGNLIAGSLLCAAMDKPDLSVVGVQSTGASAAVASWIEGRIVEQPCDTFAGGLATTRPGRLALDVIHRYLELALLVTDMDLYRAMATSIRHTGLVTEGAAASPIAALDRFGDALDADPVGLVLTGSWASRAEIMGALTSSP